MQPFQTVAAIALPFLNANVDTDVIIRIEHLAKDGSFADFAFEALRFLPDGSPDPACVFNQPRFQGAEILLAGPNFGCGSSREGAVTALWDLGFRVVIAPSFGDIFFANCVRNGLLPIALDRGSIDALAGQAGDELLTIDLAQQTIRRGDGCCIPFAIDPQQREMLLLGADEIDLTMGRLADIEAWQSGNRMKAPWLWQVESLQR